MIDIFFSPTIYSNKFIVQIVIDAGVINISNTLFLLIGKVDN